MEQKRYIVYNTSRKPQKLDRKTGKDLRTTTEKVGFNISFKNEDGASTVVTPGKFGTTTRVNEGLLNLQREGSCVIKPYGDVTDLMQNHALTPEVNSRAVHAAKPAAEPDQKPLFVEGEGESTAPQAPSNERHDRKATAVLMGQDKHENRGGREHEAARNPDGEPNFLVKTNEVKRNRRDKGNQAGA